jgi:hypothetical protein
MPVIIGVNPVKGKRRQSAKKKPKKLAAKARKPRRNPTESKGKTAMKRKTKKGGKIRYRTRVKNVIRYRKARAGAAKKVSRRSKSNTSDALNLGRVFRASGAVALGMIVAKVAVNKLTEGGSEKVAWSWPNIFMAAGSSVVAAFVLGAFGMKKPTVALVAVGGVGLALYKTFTCKVAPRWAWTEDWFGADELPPYIPYGADDELEVVDFEPVGATEGGGQLVARNPYMGATSGGGRLVGRNPNMGAGDYQAISARSRTAYGAGGIM